MTGRRLLARAQRLLAGVVLAVSGFAGRPCIRPLVPTNMLPHSALAPPASAATSCDLPVDQQ